MDLCCVPMMNAVQYLMQTVWGAALGQWSSPPTCVGFATAGSPVGHAPEHFQRLFDALARGLSGEFAHETHAARVALARLEQPRAGGNRAVGGAGNIAAQPAYSGGRPRPANSPLRLCAKALKPQGGGNRRGDGAWARSGSVVAAKRMLLGEFDGGAHGGGSAGGWGEKVLG